MCRFILILLLASMLAACGASPDAPLTAGSSAADQQTTAVATQEPQQPSTIPATTAAAATERPAGPTATYVPTPTTAPAAPTADSTPSAVPTVTLAPTTAPQPVTKTIIAERSTVTGTVTIDAQRPIPPQAMLRVKFGRQNRDGIGYFSMIDQQEFPIQDAKPVSFALTYGATDVEPFPGSQIPDTYHIVAELIAPGRVPWYMQSEPLDLKQASTPVAVTLAPPANIGEINGTLTIPDQPALPADATLTVRLVSQGGYHFDASSNAELVVPSVQPGKLPFTLEYPTRAIDPQQSYSIHAEVRAGAKLPLTSLAPVAIQGNPSKVDVVLAPPTSIATVTGTITYAEEQKIPVDAQLTIEINDVAMADGPSYVLVSNTITPVPASPVSFAIEYDPVLIDQQGMYGVYVRIMVGEKLLFINDVHYGVITEGNDKPVEMKLRTLD